LSVVDVVEEEDIDEVLEQVDADEVVEQVAASGHAYRTFQKPNHWHLV
jgi:hypothetical protein